jgi:serine/threonine protein kinase
MRPQRLGRYELLRHLASGGMARVFLARVTGPGGFARHVVVKTIPEEHRDDEDFVSMFLDEARLVATLHHQHIAQVFEVGRADDGTYFLAMEYVHGETVRHVLEAATKRRTELSLDLGLSITCAAAAGLHHAHERRDLDGTPLGIVHRDVSPSNVILGFDGSVKLIDFGIAKAHMRNTQTAIGFVKGKAGYMAPEQARGELVDRRSDVFALGVLAYELTTQTRAFHGPSQFETIRRTIHGEIDPPSRRVVSYPPALEDVVMTALAPDPADRFQDAEAMRVALDQVAREIGATLGDAPVIRALDKLFPPRAEPWFASSEPEDDNEPTAPLPDDSDPLILIAPRTSTKIRLARGTENPEGDAASSIEPEPLPAPERRPSPVAMDLTTTPFERSSQPAIGPLLAGAETAPISTYGRARRTASRISGALPLPPTPATPTPFPALAAVIAKPTVAASVEAIAAPVVPNVSARRVRTTQLLDRQGRHRYALVVTGAGIVLMVLLAIVLQRKSSTTSPPPPRDAAHAVQPAPPPRPPPAPAPVVAQPRTTVTLQVTTDPPGATVVLDGVRLGVTPFSAPVAIKSTDAWLKVRMHGYAAVKTRVSLNQDVRWDVELRQLRGTTTP